MSARKCSRLSRRFTTITNMITIRGETIMIPRRPGTPLISATMPAVIPASMAATQASTATAGSTVAASTAEVIENV